VRHPRDGQLAMTLLFALSSSLLWGVADFFGGKASRGRLTVLVVCISQAAGLFVALFAAAVAGSFDAPPGYVPWAIGAGLSGAAAVVLFYQALAIGTMGVVAPVAALGVVIPVVIGVLSGTMPSALCVAGIVLAIGGVATTARSTTPAARSDRRAYSIVLAVGAAAGFGLLQYAISGGSAHSTVMTMVVMRCTSVPVLTVVAVVTLLSRREWRETSKLFPPRMFVLIIAIGVFDVGANLMFAEASVSGPLAIVAVLWSLYPATTVLLARIVDQERMSKLQNVGVLAALTGVAMIAAGSR
jgi:drug/metabolite transporter (DMT)-like permease